MLAGIELMPFGEKLQQLRESLGLSQSALAEKAGLSIRNIQNWEQGHRGPSAKAVLALAVALDVPTQELLEELTDTKRTTKKRPRGRPRKRD